MSILPTSGGVLPVDKPDGPTSHDVVDGVRRVLGTRRVGHTGTLDPFASGLLLLCVGPATRLSEYLTGMDKRYRATARLGVETDTLDREGEVVGEDEVWRSLDPSRIEAALEAMVGVASQVPPAFSAKKIDGEAAHRKARRGETVELEAVDVTLHSLEMEAWEPPELTFRVHCSTGTYIRAIARDLGQALGTGAHLTGLRRESVGRFHVADAVSLDRLDPEAAIGALIPPAEALSHLPRIDVDAQDARRLAQGQRIPLPEGWDAGDLDPIAVLLDGELVAVGHPRDGALQPRKVFG